MLTSRTNDNYCNKKIEIEMHQRILGAEIVNIDHMIIYHSTGSGKTCASLQIANRIATLDRSYDIYFIIIKQQQIMNDVYWNYRHNFIDENFAFLTLKYILI